MDNKKQRIEEVFKEAMTKHGVTPEDAHTALDLLACIGVARHLTNPNGNKVFADRTVTQQNNTLILGHTHHHLGRAIYITAEFKRSTTGNSMVNVNASASLYHL